MKIRRFSLLFPGLAVIFFFCQGIIAQIDLSKEFHEEFQADKNTILTIENTYGDVDIKDWGKNTVKIDVIVEVKHSNAERAEKLLSTIDVAFNVDGNHITAKTVLDEKFNSISNWRDDNDLRINYTIQLPKDIELNLYNKYGDIFISELTGKAKIGLKYGKLKANRIYRGDLKPLTEIDLSYSEASIEESCWLKVTMKYSKLNLANTKAVVLLSKYSKLFVDECSSLVIEGKYDRYEIGSLSNLVASTDYSGFRVKEIKEKLDLQTSYTDCDIEYVPPAFESINIDTKYGGYRIGIDENASYKLDGVAEYAKIYYNDSGNISRIAENTSTKVFGTVGNDTDPDATVKVVSKYGNVRLTD